MEHETPHGSEPTMGAVPPSVSATSLLGNIYMLDFKTLRTRVEKMLAYGYIVLLTSSKVFHFSER